MDGVIDQRTWWRALAVVLLLFALALGACSDDESDGDSSGSESSDDEDDDEGGDDVEIDEVDADLDGDIAGVVELDDDLFLLSGGGDALRFDGDDWEEADTDGLDDVVGVAGDGSEALAVTDAGDVRRSEDGEEWDEVDASGLDGEPTGLTSGPDGYVAWGSNDGGHQIWQSDDGEDWEALEVDGLPTDDEEFSFSISDLAVGGNGWLLVLSSFGYDDGGYSIHESDDGEDWDELDERIEDVFECPNCEVDPRIAADDDQFYAFGGADHYELLTSEDGDDWDGEEVDDRDLPEQTTVDELASTESGLVAAYAEDDTVIIWRLPAD